MTSSSMANIYNMLSLADNLGTSGQPTSAQLAAIKEAGYEVVINLATGTTPRDLPNEAAMVAAQGMEYIHIPVIWDNPTEADLARFFEVMDATNSPFAPSGPNYLNFQLPVERRPQSQPLEDVFL